MSDLAYKLSEDFTYVDYCSWDDGERYELIDGIAYAMAAPSVKHQRISRELFAQFNEFLKDKPCEVLYAPFDVRLFPRRDDEDTTVVQPDLLVVCDESKLSDGKACKGAPDLVIEVSSKSTLFMDRKVKAEKYREAGVKEYWIVDHDNLNVIVNLLNNGRYDSTFYTNRVPAVLLPGLTIDLDIVRSRASS